MSKIWPTVLSVLPISIAVLISAENIYANQIEQTLEVRVSQENDDCEEGEGGKMFLNSSDLELVNDSGDQTVGVGLRFQYVPIPQGSIITSAYVQFCVDEVSAGGCALTIRGQAADDAAVFTANPHDISSRPMTTALKTWAPPAWNTRGEAGPDQRTPDISGVIQEIVSRNGWNIGNAIVIVFTGTGTRTAESYEGAGTKAALLHIEYTAPAFVAPRTDPSAVKIERRIQVRVSQDNDDCEESEGGKMLLNSSDLELVNDSGDQTVGLRFQNVLVPQGATITRAYVQFYVNELSTGACALTIRGHAADDAAAFTASPHDISSRPMTAVLATWNPPAWNIIGEAGPDQRTSDISGVIQEIVSRDGWSGGNAMVIILTGTGTRTAESYGSASAKAALLQIEYTAWVSDPSRYETPSPSILDVLGAEVRARHLALEFGVYNFGLDYAADDDAAVDSRREGDLGYTSGYGRIRYLTNPWHGFRLGGAAIGAFNIYQEKQGWAEQAVDRNSYYIQKVQFYYQNAQLYEAFLRYGISKSYIKVGRQRMNSIRFGYDSAEGISVDINELGRVSFLFETFWRGLEDADHDEISEWGTVKKHGGRRGEAANNVVFSIQTDITTPRRRFHFTPYYYVQKDFMSAFGTRARLAFPRGNVKYRFTLEAITADEATPYVEYDACWRALVITPQVVYAGFRAEAGYHKMSSVPEGKVPAYTYWMNNLNPMENGKRVLQSGADTYYARLAYKRGRVGVRVRFATCDAPIGYDAKEWGFRLRYDLTRYITVDVEYFDYDDQAREADYTKVETLLRFML